MLIYRCSFNRNLPVTRLCSSTPRLAGPTCHAGIFVLCWTLCLTVPRVLFGQASQSPPNQNHDHDHDHDHQAQSQFIDYSPETDKFKLALEEFRTGLKALRTAEIRYHNSDTKEQESRYRREWYEALQPLFDLQADVLSAALEEFQSNPNGKQKLGHILFNTLKRNAEKDNFDGMLPIAKLLFEMNYPSTDLPQIYMQCCLAENDYDQARIPIQSSKLSIANPQALLEQLDRLKEDWDLEQQARQRDLSGEPLPMAKIRTTKGDVVVELFENEAPEAVSSFVSLAEQGFYEYLDFFYVDNHSLAQTGCMKEDGTGTPPYMLPDENQKPNARKLFRGSLALSTIPNQPNSGGTVFFIPYLPALGLDNNYTVFGRVVSGMPVVANLNRVKPDRKDQSSEDKKKEAKSEPDEIISIEILRKRAHEYQPTKIAIAPNR